MGLNLESKISLDHSGFERGMHHVKESVSENIKAFALGAIGVGTVEEAFHRTIETAEELVNSSKRLNMTVEQVQLLRQAAKDAGQEFDTVASSIEKINIARAKALGGDKKAMAAFSALGVNKQDLKTKTGADLFTGKIGDKVKTTNVEEIAQPLREVLGRGAGTAVAILKTDFNELGKKMQDVGAIMDGQTAAKLKLLSDEFEMMSRVIVTQLAPALLAFAKWAYEIVLKAGGKVAKTAAEAGSVYAQTGSVGKFAKLVIETDFNALKKGLGFQGQSQADINKKYNVSADEVKKAGTDAEEPWKKSLDEFEAALKKAGEDVSKPPKPDFTKTESNAKKMAEKKERQPKQSDALVKVGNFLGASKGVINSTQSMLVQHAAETARNTKTIATTLTSIANKSQRAGTSGGSGETDWPSN